MECRHCHRTITLDPTDGWVDPEATGDDDIWRVTCDEHDTFTAEHEPRTIRADDGSTVIVVMGERFEI